MHIMDRRIRVGVIFGGRSGEHEVSLASARSILNNIDVERYEPVPIGITKEGRWIVGGDPLAALGAGSLEGTTSAPMLPDPAQRGLMKLDAVGGVPAPRMLEPLDVVFPV